MKRLLAFVLIFGMITGCDSVDSGFDRALAFRQTINNKECEFSFIVSADYDESIMTFSMNCLADVNGNITFTVSNPESIQGISGRITENGSELIFDDQVLALAPVTEDLESPIISPWLFIKSIRTGYIDTVSACENGIRVHIDDSFADIVYSLHIWMDENDLPYSVDFMVDDCRIMSARIENFIFK